MRVAWLSLCLPDSSGTFCSSEVALFSRLVAAIAPYLIWIALVGGIAVGGSVVGWIQSVRIERRDVRIQGLEQTAEWARTKAEADASLAEATISGLTSDLAAAHRMQRIEYVETIKEIERVASGTNQCLSADTLSVLRGAQDRGDAKGSNSRVPPRPGTGFAPDSSGSVTGSASSGGGGDSASTGGGSAASSGGASEKAIANWMASALQQYKSLQRRNVALAETIRGLPCVEIVNDEEDH